MNQNNQSSLEEFGLAGHGDTESRLLETCLARPELHEEWMNGYRVADNEGFFENAFDYITTTLAPPRNATFLDAGCGTCAHSIRLARRGYRVVAVDFSESVLRNAKAIVRTGGLTSRIRVRHENLLSLSFESQSFSYVLCWGVLMHVPDIARAIAELARVLRPGGALVVSEGNMHSLQSLSKRCLAPLRRPPPDRKRTPAGVEYWQEHPAGTIMTREADIGWLTARFRDHGLRLVNRRAGQFTEVYTRLSSLRMRKFVHGLNNLWFRWARIPHLAYGNLLILEKQAIRRPLFAAKD